MLTLDVFNQDAFGAIELTDAVNVVPNQYGLLQQMNLFPGQGIETTSFGVVIDNGVLNILPTRPRGSQATLAIHGKRSMKIFPIPHIPHEDNINADDIQNVIMRSMGGGIDNEQLQLENLQNMVNRRQMEMRRKHNQTLEYLRMGALKGVILDADGSTIVDLFAEFGVTEKVVSFELDIDSTDVVAIARSVLRYMEDNLLGDTMTSVVALCSPEFFDALIGHPEVREAYKYFNRGGPSPLTDDVRQGFPFGGVLWQEYRGSVTRQNPDNTKTTLRFIPAGECRFVPRGTGDTMMTKFGPADFLDAVNRPGIEVFSRMAVDPLLNRWALLHTQSNPLPICTRPAVLVRGTLT
jgi:hypothetical protein